MLYYQVENIRELEGIPTVSDIQKASLWKRIAAGILDLILVMILATGAAWGISALVNYDSYNSRFQQGCQDYMTRYGLPEEAQELTPELESLYQQANDAIAQDENAIYLFNMVISLMLLIVTGGILFAYLVAEWLIPLLLGNGQTVGKKVFSLCLIRNDGVQLNNIQLFARTILGKFAVGTMILVYTAIMLWFGQLNFVSLLLALAVLITQPICFAATRHHCLLHDLMVGTVVADYGSQKIFKSTDDLIAYQKKIAAERAARQTY